MCVMDVQMRKRKRLPSRRNRPTLDHTQTWENMRNKYPCALFQLSKPKIVDRA